MQAARRRLRLRLRLRLQLRPRVRLRAGPSGSRGTEPVTTPAASREIGSTFDLDRRTARPRRARHWNPRGAWRAEVSVLDLGRRTRRLGSSAGTALVEPVDVGQAAPQHDRPAGSSRLITLGQAAGSSGLRSARRVASAGGVALPQRRRSAIWAGSVRVWPVSRLVVGGQSPGPDRKVSMQPVLAAVARPGPAIPPSRGQGRGLWPHSPAMALCAGQHPLADRPRARRRRRCRGSPRTRSSRPRAGTVDRLRQSETVGIVLDLYRSATAAGLPGRDRTACRSTRLS